MTEPAKADAANHHLLLRLLNELVMFDAGSKNHGMSWQRPLIAEIRAAIEARPKVDAQDAKRLDWLERDMKLGDEGAGIAYEDTINLFGFPYLVSNVGPHGGGIGGGVGWRGGSTLRDAIDAAIAAQEKQHVE